MKNIKDYILIISFSFIAIIVFLIFSLFINKKTYVELSTPEDVVSDFNMLKDNIKEVKNEKCRNSLNELLNNYIDTSFEGKVKMIDFYNYISTYDIIKYYKVIKEDCNISDELIKKYNIDNRYLVEMSLSDEMLLPYFYQFELSFHDRASVYYYPDIVQMTYTTLKNNEVQLINDYLHLIGE